MIVYQLAILTILSMTVNGKYYFNNNIKGGNDVIKPKNTNSPLGKGFFLAELDIYASRVGGSDVFSEIPASCIIHYPHEKESMQDMDHYNDTSSFYHKTATDSKISADLTGEYTMGMTLEVKTSGVSSGFKDVQGASLRMWTYTSREVLDDNCYRKSSSRLSSDFIKRVQMLPLEIKDPRFPANWEDYENFCKAFGSHIVTQVDKGSSIRQWTFAEKSQNYKSTDFELSACANFEGPTEVGKLGINACSGYTSKDVEKVSHYDIHSHIDVLGGEDGTAHELLNTRSRTLLKQLMDEGRKNPADVQYAYEPVWDLIKLKFPGSDTKSKSMRAKAENLRQYYQGFKDYDCSYVEKNELALRYFTHSIHSSTYNPVFECSLTQEGCRDDHDCHLHGNLRTYCSGERCVEYQPPTKFGVKSWTADIRTTSSGCSSCGPNRSCKYTDPFKAVCDLGVLGSTKTIWPE